MRGRYLNVAEIRRKRDAPYAYVANVEHSPVVRELHIYVNVSEETVVIRRHMVGSNAEKIVLVLDLNKSHFLYFAGF